MPESQEGQALGEGQLLGGRYRLAEQLGQGGMGVVFKALDLETSGTVAVKLLDRDRSGRDDLVRFRREFRAALRLSHPSCVQVLDLGTQDDRAFFTMEYVAGGRLDTRAPVEPHVAVAIALQVLAALDHLHAKQIVHRDVKPQNILVLPGEGLPPRVKLCDLGIAKGVDLSEDARAGDIIGSFRYLAPEQAERGLADARADLYALGVVLYELLAGHSPWPQAPAATHSTSRSNRGSASAIRTLRQREPKPLALEAPDVPAPLCTLVMQLLERDPKRRPSSAAEASDALRAWFLTTPPAWDLPALPPLERKPSLAVAQFVGRRAELGRIETFLEDAFSNRPFRKRLLLISGPAGAGKSRLIGQAIRLAQTHQAKVQIGTCSADVGFSFEQASALLDLEARLDRASGHGDSTTGALPDPKASETASQSASHPDLGNETSVPNTQAPASVEPGPSTEAAPAIARWLFQRELCDRLLALAVQTPVLILLEDAQWADALALQLLALVLRMERLAEQSGLPPRLAILVTHRPAAQHEALAALRAQAESLDALETLTLAPLTDGEAAELVGSMLMTKVDVAERAFAAGLRARTEGNPLFIAEVVHALLATGRLRKEAAGWNLGPELLDGAHAPSTLQDAIGDRAARLGVGTKRVLELAAVAGKRVDLQTLETGTKLEPAQVLDCLDEAIRGGFLEESAESHAEFVFAQDRVRELIYGRLPAQSLALLHGEVARALEGRPGQSGERAADLAHHFRHSGDRSKAFVYGVKAAERAMAAYAFREAAALYETAFGQARPEDLTPELQERYGDACLQSGLYDQAEQAFEARLRSLGAAPARADLLRKLADIELRRGNMSKAIGLFETTLRELGSWVPQGRLAVIGSLCLNGARCLLRAFFPKLRPHPELSQSSRDRLELSASIYARLGEIQFHRDTLRAVQTSFATLDLAEHLGPGRELLLSCAVQAYVLLALGFSGVAERYRARAQLYWNEGGPLEQAVCEVRLTLYACCAGKPVEGLEHARHAATLLAEVEDPDRALRSWSLHFRVAMMLGRRDEARRVGQQIQRLAEELRDDISVGWSQTYVGHQALRDGRLPEAVRTLREAHARLERDEDVITSADASSSLACALVQSGEPKEARALLLATLDRFLTAKTHHPLRTIEGQWLTAAALVVQSEGPEAALSAAVERLVHGRESIVGKVRTLQPAFVAGRAAWAAVNGKTDEAQRLFQIAAASASRMELAGELQAVQTLRERVLPVARNRAA